MMSLRSWLALLVFYVLYLLMGGYIFNAIECPGEMAEKERDAAERRDVRMLVLELKGERKCISYNILDAECLKINSTGIQLCDLFADKLPAELASNLTSIIGRMDQQNAASRERTSKGRTNAAPTETKVKDCEKWSVYNSFFFSFTAITTVGYGKIAPETQGCVWPHTVSCGEMIVCSFAFETGSTFLSILSNALRIIKTTRYVACAARERYLHIVFVARGPHQWHPHRDAWSLFRQKGRRPLCWRR